MIPDHYLVTIVVFLHSECPECQCACLSHEYGLPVSGPPTSGTAINLTKCQLTQLEHRHLTA